MKNCCLALFIFAIGEVIALPMFYFVRKLLKMQKSDDPLLALVSGVLERLVILSGLYMSVTQIVAMFAGFKVAIRLSPENGKQVKKSNEYFLTGNLLSVLLALVYNWVYLRYRQH